MLANEPGAADLGEKRHQQTEGDYARTNVATSGAESPAEVREAVDALAAPVVAKLKNRYCKPAKSPQFNWPDDLFTRWHRDALYFVVVMRTPHGRPPTFETHAARMEHASNGKFNLAVPMRRGWNTIKKNATPEECLKEISEYVCF